MAEKTDDRMALKIARGLSRGGWADPDGLAEFLGEVGAKARGCIVCRAEKPAGRLPSDWFAAIFVAQRAKDLGGLPYVGYVLCGTCRGLPDVEQRAEEAIFAEFGVQ